MSYVKEKTVVKVAIDGVIQESQPDELLIDLINRTGGAVPHVCYHPQLGPVQTCDTCMVEENGRLVRACAIRVADGMSISTKSATASAAQVEAFDRILSNHLLYCTVCDNNNGNCTVHNTTKLLAIEHQRIPFRSKPYEVDNTKTGCTDCGVGGSFDVWTKDRHILKIAPEHGPANGISTCVKGKFGWGHIDSPDRLTTPLIREGNEFRPATWDEALSLIARRFSELKAANGPDCMAFISSSKCTNEESYLMQKLARAVIGTNNVDNCSRYCQAPATAGLFRTVGYGGDSGSISDIEAADLVLIIGSNTAESHPVIATRVKSSHKLNGQKLIVSDLRENEMARRADLFIHPKPGTDLVWLNAISRYLLDNGLAHSKFLDQWVNGLDAYRKSLEPFTMEAASRISGLSEETLQTVAHMIVEAKSVCILWAMGVTQHSQGSDTSTAISNLLLITGNYMRPGTGAYPMRGHNNVQGASDHGSMPNDLPGYQSVDDPEVRARFEKAWNVPLPSTKGLDNHEMGEAMHADKLRSMYVIGEEMSIVDSNANYVSAAFEKLDFFVVQDIFFSNTCRYADVVLPGAPSLEKEGTFTSTERRIQRLYQVLDPLEGCRPDWKIIQDVASSLGARWNY